MDTRLFAEWATLVKLISYLLTYLLTYLLIINVQACVDAGCVSTDL